MSSRTIHTIYGKRIPIEHIDFVPAESSSEWLLVEVRPGQIGSLPKQHNIVPVLNIDELLAESVSVEAIPQYPRIVLSVDEDSDAILRLSPRYSEPENRKRTAERICELIRTFAAQSECFVALTVEELCPGGLDATDGIELARQFVGAGAAGIIASGGTRDFMPLKVRRATALKSDRGASLEHWPETWISSAMWLIGKIDVPVYAQGIVCNRAETLANATKLGLSGIIDVSVKYPSSSLTMSS